MTCEARHQIKRKPGRVGIMFCGRGKMKQHRRARARPAMLLPLYRSRLMGDPIASAIASDPIAAVPSLLVVRGLQSGARAFCRHGAVAEPQTRRTGTDRRHPACHGPTGGAEAGRQALASLEVPGRVDRTYKGRDSRHALCFASATRRDNPQTRVLKWSPPCPHQAHRSNAARATANFPGNNRIVIPWA